MIDVVRELYEEEQELLRMLDETIEIVAPCKQCGKCCSGAIFITAFEAARIIQKGWRDFYESNGFVMVLKKRNGKCIFLKDNRCLIHDVKPFQCRAFPVTPHPWFRDKEVFECHHAVYRVNDRFEELIRRRMEFLSKYYVLVLEMGIEKIINASMHLQNTP